MAKILNVREDIIDIGLDDGRIEEVRRQDLNFVPEVGDKVEVFKSEFKTVVTKVEEKKEDNTGGININVNQNVGSDSQNPNYGGKVVNKVVYLLLTFFLGFIGIHKFYAGRIGTGILYVLFSCTAIPGILAFIEFIIVIFKPADANGNIVV